MAENGIRIRLIAVALMASTLVVSCKKETDGTTDYPAPTPYEAETPSYSPTFRNDSPDNPMTVEGIALGRALFFDSTLSKDGTVACVSCHDPKHGFSDPNQFSKGVFNQHGKRNSMALANLRFESHFFWDGRAGSLEEQATKPIQDPTEMGMTPLEVEAAIKKKDKYKAMFGKAFGTEEVTFTKATRAIAQYVRSLSSFNSRYDRYLLGTYTPTTEELEGMKLFFTHPVPASGIRGANCGDCHFLPLLTGVQNGFEGFKNNGTSSYPGDDIGLMKVTGDSGDFGKFKIPSLRNIELTAPYMHDGRFETLEEVVDHYNNPELFYHPHVDVLITNGKNNRFGESLDLQEDEKQKVLAFLRMLTDSTISAK